MPELRRQLKSGVMRRFPHSARAEIAAGSLAVEARLRRAYGLPENAVSSPPRSD
jgi:hypothetical protein